MITITLVLSSSSLSSSSPPSPYLTETDMRLSLENNQQYNSQHHDINNVDAETAADVQEWLHQREEELFRKSLADACEQKWKRYTTESSLRLDAKRTVEKELFDTAIACGNSLTIHNAPRQYWQALTAETIANRWALNPAALFCWAERHGVELMKVNAGGRLCQYDSWVWVYFHEDKPLR